MRESRGGATGRAVVEVELDLHHLVPGADCVDRHSHLHPEAGGERQHVL